MSYFILLWALSQKEFYIWLLIVLFFVISFIGLFIPMIPSIVFLWLGFLTYHFLYATSSLTEFFWIVMGIFTVITLVADLLMNIYFVDKFGGSKWSKWAAIVGVVIGVFIYPPIGMIAVPFILVVFIELLQKKDIKDAFLAAIGTLVGMVSSAVAKALIQSLMIVIFLIYTML